VVRIVEKMCAKKPAERFQSCDELLAALDALPRSLGGRQGEGADPDEEKTRMLANPAGPAGRTALRPPPRQVRRKGARPWIGVLFGAVAAVLVLSVAAFFFERQRAAARGRIPQQGWVAREGLRKVQ